ncbi:lysozyme inhibitor LprI family protein [Sphingobium sp. DEHP117]|uniref:lysozyme inhibitor LprI family protein n=1 Tax=Sphingobium sp. DEHP117 TaxID=2993436 RepID=UPI0027D619A3|nr:lysozyme inhibitor LprI family protein [Sphingobium sp. DEHP117]MDQ4420974.1 lysozyme inhibitor LprI family protein [Sphingobium sp. DEHP117]
MTAVLVFSGNAERTRAENVQNAQSIVPDPFEQCLNTGDAKMAVMSAMIDCDDEELARKNVVLNQTYQVVRKKLNPAQQRHLVILERLWIAHRDQKCKAEALATGGQDGQVTWYGCMIDETERRIDWLKSRSF